LLDRRRFLAGTSAVLLATPIVAEAQSSVKVPRIAFLNLGSPPVPAPLQGGPFIKRLRELGYEEGRSIAIERRFADGKVDRLPNLAAELVGMPVDVIISGDTDAILAVRRLSQTVPIVMTQVADPVGSGLVTSLARPGGNTTGMTIMASELAGKRLELLREIVPRATSVAVLALRDHRPTAQFIRETEVAARALKVRLQIVQVRNPEEFDTAFASMVSARAGAVIIQNNFLFNSQIRRLADLTIKHHLPATYAFRNFTDAGGLMVYGANSDDLWRRAANYVDKILKGAKPADLPIEQPTKFDLIINLKTAKALGLTIPGSVLSRADEVIQ
jgi:putative tryptophan/tyrosine transport system substrate-binding protein